SPAAGERARGRRSRRPARRRGALARPRRGGPEGWRSGRRRAPRGAGGPAPPAAAGARGRGPRTPRAAPRRPAARTSPHRPRRGAWGPPRGGAGETESARRPSRGSEDGEALRQLEGGLPALVAEAQEEAALPGGEGRDLPGDAAQVAVEVRRDADRVGRAAVER